MPSWTMWVTSWKCFFSAAKLSKTIVTERPKLLTSNTSLSHKAPPLGTKPLLAKNEAGVLAGSADEHDQLVGRDMGSNQRDRGLAIRLLEPHRRYFVNAWWAMCQAPLQKDVNMQSGQPEDC